MFVHRASEYARISRQKRRRKQARRLTMKDICMYMRIHETAGYMRSDLILIRKGTKNPATCLRKLGFKKNVWVRLSFLFPLKTPDRAS